MVDGLTLAERSAGGACGPTGASVMVSRSRCRLAQIERADLVGAEQHVEAAILVARTQRDTAVAEGPADLEWPIAEAQPAIAVDPPDDRPGAIVERRDLLRKAAPARAIARRRGRQIERLMRPLGVVYHPPGIKALLALGKIGKRPPADDLSRQRAMKPLVLSLGLRMVGPTMADRDTELEQPHRQPGVAMHRVGPPRRNIVGQHPVGQTIAPEDRRQRGLHRARALVAAGPQPKRVTRVVIDHRQRVAAPRGGGKMPLVIHLPQLVRRRPLKPLKWFVSSARPHLDAAIAVQYRSHCARARHPVMAEILQPTTDLAPAPGRALVTDRQHPLLHFRRCARRRALRAPRPVRQTRLALLLIARPQPIANRRADAKPSAQLATVYPVLLEQHHKLMSLRHDRLLRPRHPSPSPTGQRCR